MSEKIIDLNGLEVIKLSQGVYKDVKTGSIITQVSPVYTRLEDAIFKKKKRIVVLEGGTRSTKTYSLIQFLIDISLRYPKLKTNIVRKHLTRAKQGIMIDFYDVMSSREIYDRKRFNGETNAYKYPNDSCITFIVAVDREGVKGTKQHILALDEGTEMPEEIYLELQQRTKNAIIFTFNPCMDKNHWIYRTILKRDDNGNLLNEDVEYIHSTYKDNCFLNEKEIRAIEQYEPTPENVLKGVADACRWAIYGLGIYAEIAGKIYGYEVIEDFPTDLDLVCYGTDTGYSPDPVAVVRKGEKYVDFDGSLYPCLYLDEVVYETELLSTRNINNPNLPSIQSRFEESGVPKDTPIYCDSNDPDRIADLQASGYNITKVIKSSGADREGSINFGISLVKSYKKIYVTSRSVNLIKELDFYREEIVSGKRKRLGAHHACDAFRYAVMMTCPLAKSTQSKEPKRVKLYDAINMSRYG